MYRSLIFMSHVSSVSALHGARAHLHTKAPLRAPFTYHNSVALKCQVANDEHYDDICSIYRLQTSFAGQLCNHRFNYWHNIQSFNFSAMHDDRHNVSCSRMKFAVMPCSVHENGLECHAIADDRFRLVWSKFT